MATEDNSHGIYKPLGNPEKEIRLLSLLPADSEDATEDSTLKGTLCHRFLDDDPPYTALSYVWGNPNDTRTMIVDGHEVQITTNLADALYQLRRHRFRTIWADALCINQRNEKEKGHQVQKMGTIFKKATEVFAWVGTGDDESIRATEQIDALATIAKEFGLRYLWNAQHMELEKMRNNHGYRALQHLCDPLVQDSTLSDLDLNPMLRFFDRKFWRRLWILQEVALATTARVACGPWTISWPDLCASATFLFWFSDASRYNTKLRNRLRSKQLSPLGYGLWIPPPSVLLSSFLSSGRTLDPLNLFDFTCNETRLQSTDPKDRVFALLGFWDDHNWARHNWADKNWAKREEDAITVDYTASCSRVYTEITCAALQYNNTWALEFAGLASRSGVVPELPSWVLDWTHTGGKFWLSFRGFSACGSQSPRLLRGVDRQTAIDTGVIILGGSLVDTVVAIVPFSGQPEDIQSTFNNLEDKLSQSVAENKCKRSQSDVQDAVWRTMVLDVNDTRRRRVNGEDRKLFEMWYERQKLSIPRDPQYESANAFFDKWFDPLRSSRTTNTGAVEFENLVYWRPGKFVLSSQGYIGRAFEEAQVGDQICIFKCATVPFLIRPGADGAFHLISAVYVHGIMDGEFMGKKPPTVEIKLY